MRLLTLLKRGNLASGLAALGNLVISVVKFIVAAISGNGTMFATAMHSMADTVNQSFVYIGSVLAEMRPSDRFPIGFGRIINIFCMIAVIVVTVMGYETIKTGWELFRQPQASSDFLLNIIVLLIAFFIDGYVLYRTMNEIASVGGSEQKGNLLTKTIKNARRASPATRLVYYEDIVATLGAILAIIGIVFSQGFGLLAADGLVSMLIGLLMLMVAYRVGFDNMMGLIGVAAPAEMEDKIGNILLAGEHVVDIYGMRILQEGRAFHVDVTVELSKGLSLAEADDIKFQLTDKLLDEPNITDVVLGIIEDDDKENWPNDNWTL